VVVWLGKKEFAAAMAFRRGGRPWSSPVEVKSRLERRQFLFTVERVEESKMLHP
jgi:hypothetical protein